MLAPRVVVGDPNPDFTGGWTNTFSYKGIDLNVFFTFVQGADIFNSGGNYMTAGFAGGFDNQTIDIVNAWSQPGDITNVPRSGMNYGSGARTASRWLYSMPSATSAPSSWPSAVHREVVAVDVGDQEPADVAEPRPDRAQAPVQQLARLRDRPAAVDQDGQPVVGADDVDVDRLEPVHRQRQRDPMDALGDRPGALDGPVLARVGRHGVRRGGG